MLAKHDDGAVHEEGKLCRERTGVVFDGLLLAVAVDEVDAADIVRY